MFIIFSPRFELPATDITQKEGKKLVIVCHFCGESGHKALYCEKMPVEMKEAEAKQLEFRVSYIFNFLKRKLKTNVKNIK